jgi:glycosyltransferase involved in cell wall biosynthesis
MKVLWVADFGLKHNIGGAQRTDSLIIKEGENRGHSIQFFNYDTPSDLLQGEYDLVVSGNLENLHRRDDVFSFLLNHSYHVRYEHDSNAYLPQQMRKDLFASTRRTFFLSEFHHKTFKELYGDIFQSVDIVTSPIDVGQFKDKGLQRDDKTLYVGFMHFLKGTQAFFKTVLTNPDRQFVMAAWGQPNLERTARSFKNVEWLGKVDYEGMPDLFNKYKTLYYHPAKFEPFCRSVGEAMLCGIELDCGDNIGAIHDLNAYGLDGVRERCNKSPSKFWDLIEG